MVDADYMEKYDYRGRRAPPAPVVLKPRESIPMIGPGRTISNAEFDALINRFDVQARPVRMGLDNLLRHYGEAFARDTFWEIGEAGPCSRYVIRVTNKETPTPTDIRIVFDNAAKNVTVRDNALSAMNHKCPYGEEKNVCLYQRNLRRFGFFGSIDFGKIRPDEILSAVERSLPQAQKKARTPER